MRCRSVASFIGVGLILAAASSSAGPRAGVAAATQPGTFVHLSLTALQLPDRVRYSIVPLSPSESALDAVRVHVTLPPGAELVDALETPGRTQFIGREGDTLAWSAPLISANDVTDAFTFVLGQPLSAPARVRLSWSTGSTEIAALPQPIVAIAAHGTVAVGPAGSGNDLFTIGDTGVRVRVEPGSVREETLLDFVRLGPETNPPADDGLWWCAGLTVEGLPTGVSILVIVPTRQPLPPNAEVRLSAERGGAWEALDQVGIATIDGQFVAFAHPGGTVAAGVARAFQPSAVLASRLPVVSLTRTPSGEVPPTPGPTPFAPRPQLAGLITGNGSIRSFLNTNHEIRIENRGIAPALGVYVDIRENNLGLDFIGIDPPSCRIVQRLGAAPLMARAECDVGLIPAGSAFVAKLEGGTASLFGLGVGQLSVTATDNFGGAPTTGAQGAMLIFITP